MQVKKYTAKIANTEKEIIGYLIEQRKYIGNGCYSNTKEYCIYVTEFSMPNSNVRGCFLVNKNTIRDFYGCAVCKLNEVKQEFFNSACSIECYKEL
jgi:hypothetical protein